MSLLDEVVAVLLQPGEGLVGDMAGGRVKGDEDKISSNCDGVWSHQF